MVGRAPHEHSRARVAVVPVAGTRARGRPPPAPLRLPGPVRATLVRGGGRHLPVSRPARAPSHCPARLMASTGPAADAARAAFRERMDAKGHAVDNARQAVEELEASFGAGALERTPALDQMLGDLMVALEQDEG